MYSNRNIILLIGLTLAICKFDFSSTRFIPKFSF